MKFRVEKEVFEKFPNMLWIIPIIIGFNNNPDEETKKEIVDFLRSEEEKLKERFPTIESLKENSKVQRYKELFAAIGANTKKVFPTHIAMARRVIEGGQIPDINPALNICNALSLKYLTPFGEENLASVYGDFYLTFAKGDEQWIGLGKTESESPKPGELVWRDEYDVSSRYLNWRQGERTKLDAEVKDGYFIMDSFSDLDRDNVEQTAEEFVQLMAKWLGGESKIYRVDTDNPEVEVDYETKEVTDQMIQDLKTKAEDSKVKDKAKSQEKKVEIKKYLFPNDSNAFRIQNLLVKVLHNMGVDKSVDEIHLEQPANGQFGDYSTNVAMTLAGELKQNPRQIADQIIANIKNPEIGGDEHFLSRIEVAGPGFINFTINSSLIKEELMKVLEHGDAYGKNDLRKGKLVMVEFGQPNTHKAFHIGHLKSAVSGLSMVRLHEALGYDVIKANYYGDVGMHVAKSIWGYMQKGKPDAFEVWDEHRRMKYIDECYVYGSAHFKEDENAKAEMKAINKKIYDKSDPKINEIYEQTRTWSLEHLNSMFKELGVEYDVQYPESTTFKHGIELVKQHIGDIFEESDGAIIYDGKKEGLTTWVFLTQEGIPTYSAKDLGLGYKKFEDYNLDLSVYTTSVEQKDYFKVVFRCLELIRPDLKGKSIHVPFGWMLREGRKMSSRQGQTLKGMDLLEEIKAKANDLISVEKEYSEAERAEVSHAVAMAGLKFVILSHEFHKDFNYDPDKFLSLSGFSGPYLLYTYARAKSILTKTGMEIRADGMVFADHAEKNVKDIKISEFDSILESDYEMSLLRHINRFGDTVMAAGLNISPHIICTYLYELAQRFNQFYTNIPVTTAEEGQKEARIMLTAATAQVLKNGLRMLGIETVERM